MGRTPVQHRQTSFYLALLHCAPQGWSCLRTEGKVLCQQNDDVLLQYWLYCSDWEPGSQYLLLSIYKLYFKLCSLSQSIAKKQDPFYFFFLVQDLIKEDTFNSLVIMFVP